MPLGDNFATGACLAAFLLAVAVGRSAPSPPAPHSMEFSHCQNASLPSPNGKWRLEGSFVDGACPAPATCPRPGTHDSFATAQANDYGVVLLVEDTTTHTRRAVAFAGYEGEAAWSPSSEAFFVNDHIGSNVVESSLIFAASLRSIDIREAVRQADPGSTRYLVGHSYLRSRRWLDAHTALVQLCGHTDRSPSMQFDLRYSVTLEGSAKRLSMRLRPAIDDNQHQECE